MPPYYPCVQGVYASLCTRSVYQGVYASLCTQVGVPALYMPPCTPYVYHP